MHPNTDLFLNVSNDADRLSSLTMTFTHPDDVLHSRVLSDADKRAVLAAWASDAHAVPNLPAMRQLDSGAIVGIDTVLAALRSLDSSRDPSTLPFASGQGLGSRPRFTSKIRWRRPPRRDDGDDDPPPSPAAALPPGVELELRRRRDQIWQLAAA